MRHITINLTLGMMLSIQYIIGQLNGPINNLIGFINGFQDARLSMERMTEIHNRTNEDDIEIFRDSDYADIYKKEIILKNISFRYEGNYSPKVLKDINLVIPENKVTAIVGSSGSGKTTLIKILIGFYKPTEGEIYVGERKLIEYPVSIWRENIGAVLQDGVIFSDTIAENIIIGNQEINVERMIEAATLADIEKFVMSMPLKYNTKVGDDGNGLSQGQKQRLLIAREIYKNPKFVFFDEATNALDATSEKTIVQNMKDFFSDKTVIVVAHRLSTVKDADKIVVLDNGTIVEEGTHEYLIEKKGAYYKLINNQLEI